ncbi:MAG: SDR family oxidoreductase [Lentisphaerae bacterium]|nr:SDR family oxidoreductase [Lentisphaerota bacterium]
MTEFADLRGKAAVITGGGGVLGSSMGTALAGVGVRVALLDRDGQLARSKAEAIAAATGGEAVGLKTDVLARKELEAAAAEVEARWGAADFLINAAGGNAPAATTRLERLEAGSDPDAGFFGVDVEAFRRTVDLNLMGTVLPSLVFGRAMARRGSGAILNISSMSAIRPLTKVVAYSASKAAVSNFTAWLAVHLAGTGVRVNAIAPGFFLTEQNRFLLTDEKTGVLTARGGKIVAGTPQRRFGAPEDLHGLVLYLLSEKSAFVTGAVVPVDGGFNAYAGV